MESSAGAREDAVVAIFDEEIAAAGDDFESSSFVDWLEGLRDRVLAAIREGSRDA